jgi:hypothetical protein
MCRINNLTVSLFFLLLFCFYYIFFDCLSFVNKNQVFKMIESKRERPQNEPSRFADTGQELAYLRSKVGSLSSLIEISIIINSALDLDSLVALVMEKAQMVMSAEASSVMLINEEENILECQVALGEVGEEIKKMRLRMGEGIAGWVAEKPVSRRVQSWQRP